MVFKGYAGHFAYDEDLDIYEGIVSNCKDGISFQGKSADDVITAFKDAINEYLELCEKMGKEPQKTFLED